MTRHVTFTKPEPGIPAGTRRLVPDDIAARLEREGRIEPNPPSFGESAAMAPEKPRRRQAYQTKAG